MILDGGVEWLMLQLMSLRWYAVMVTGLIAGGSGFAEESWQVGSEAEWQSVLANQDGLDLKNGQVSPTGEKALIKTKLQRFEKKRKASSLLVEQSPSWDNWEPCENIGPANLADAPVMLSVGEKNYWMFGRYSRSRKMGKGKGATKFVPGKAELEGFDIELLTTPWPNQFNAPGGLKKGLGGYHAWQSRDMVNWVHHGPVTPKEGKWMTSAEWVDGRAYLYYDFPNDQDPHLYLDSDLTDGKPGENKGLAFADPSDGSDSGFIRDLEGHMHVIYEDWSPIDANKRSWDSPLAGHAVSKDGMGAFEIVKPVIDDRTTPTGKFATYTHPHWTKEDPKKFPNSIARFEIHEPEQPAYGDWAAIAIGGRYYLFGDFDPPGGHSMSVGRFTAASINGPFEWCGKLGNGHPDPDIMFAEGKFYLATQQKTDFVSTGPWVERVEARVGVDTTNDGKADAFGKWTVIKESYERIPGFAKQVKRNPAQLDLTALPAGFGFQVELKVADSTKNESKPVIESFALSFGG